MLGTVFSSIVRTESPSEKKLETNYTPKLPNNLTYQNLINVK